MIYLKKITKKINKYIKDKNKIKYKKIIFLKMLLIFWKILKVT